MRINMNDTPKIKLSNNEYFWCLIFNRKLRCVINFLLQYLIVSM